MDRMFWTAGVQFAGVTRASQIGHCPGLGNTWKCNFLTGLPCFKLQRQISASPDLLEGMKLEDLVTSEFLVRLT